MHGILYERSTVIRAAHHIAEGLLVRARIREGPATYRNERLQARFAFLQLSESTIERGAVGIHGRYRECRRVEEGKGKVDRGEPIQIQVLGRNLLARTSVCPRLVVAYVPLGDTGAPGAGRALDRSASAIGGAALRIVGVGIIRPFTELGRRAAETEF